jgi:hypothetical protein
MVSRTRKVNALGGRTPHLAARFFCNLATASFLPRSDAIPIRGDGYCLRRPQMCINSGGQAARFVFGSRRPRLDGRRASKSAAANQGNRCAR